VTGSPTQPADPPPARSSNRPRPARNWVPALVALLCALTGVIDVASALTPQLHDRMRTLTEYVPGALTHAAVAATVITGILLLLLSHALRRRKRRAWLAAVGLLAASVGLHVVKGLDVEEALVALAMLVALWVFRDEFYAVGDPRTRWRALSAFLGLATLSVALGMLLLQARSGSLAEPHPLSAQLRQVLYGLVGVAGPLGYTNESTSDLVTQVLFALGLFPVVTSVYLLLRPAEPQARLAPAEEERMRSLLARHGGRDSLGYFALRRDKSVIFSPSGKAAIAYRVVSGVMLASGDPLGDPEAWPGAIARFLDECDRHAWTPAVVGCSEQGGEVWTRHGLAALELGDEALLEVADFCLAGRPMRNVRQMVSRVERNGYTAQARRLRDIAPAERAGMRAEAASWRGAAIERGFSMALGRFADPADEACVAVTAHDSDGRIRALLHFVPWGEDGLSLDLMVRDRSADPGVNEFLIISALRAAPQLGVRRLSLNFAVFRSALERGERLGAGFVLRGWRSFLIFMSRWFQIESLYRFNAKFRPMWEPRFVCYRGAADLPRIAIAALEAEAFIVWPSRPLRVIRRLARVRPA
jgi:lysyl-tRNA synthetase, class II